MAFKKYLYKIATIAFWLLLFTAILFAGVIAHLFMSKNYDGFLTYLLTLLGKPHSWLAFVQGYFSERNFIIARDLSVAFFVVTLLACYFIGKNSSKIVMALCRFFSTLFSAARNFKNKFVALQATTKILLCIFSLATLIKSSYYIFSKPLQYDEMWSYINFTEKPIWLSAILPANNHILYTITAHLFCMLPGKTDILMRLPVLLVGLLSIPAFFFFVLKYFNQRLAIIATAFFSSSCFFVFYTVYARSYMFIVFFSILLFWSFMNIRLNNNNLFSSRIFCIAVILGFWSNIIFLYSTIAVVCTTFFYCLIKRDIVFFSKIFKLLLVSILIVALLSLPVILSRHIHHLLEYTAKPENTGDRFLIARNSVKGLQYSLLGFKPMAWLAPLLLLLAACLKNKGNKLLLWMGVASYGIIIAMSFIQQKELFSRLTIFLIIFIAIAIAVLLSAIPFKLHNSLLVFLTVVIFITNSFLAHRHQNFNWSMQLDISSKKIAGLMLKENIKSCYVQKDYVKPALQYYYGQNGKAITIAMYNSSSADFVSYDSIRNYQALVLDAANPLSYNVNEYIEFYKSADILLLKAK